MCNGSRLEHTRRWVSERITYMDSVYGYGDYQLSATIRSNVTGEVSLQVKTYSPQYVEISFSDSATGTVKKWCDKDKWYTFTNTITNAVDNNITIRGITNVMYIEGLEYLNVSSMIMGQAKKLCKIDIHGSKRIQRLELGNNEMLQELNCKNCTNLGFDDNYKVIDLSKCVNLKYLDLSGTMIGTVDLNPDGGSLEFLDLSNTEITYLVCNYQEYLQAIKGLFSDINKIMTKDGEVYLVISDFTINKKETDIHSDCVKLMNDAGYSYCGTSYILQNQKAIYPFGY